MNNCVCIRTLCEELEPRLWRITMSLMLIEYDDDADGYLTLHEVQRWLSDFAGDNTSDLEQSDCPCEFLLQCWLL